FRRALPPPAPPLLPYTPLFRSPAPESLEPPLEHPLGLALPLGDEADDVLVEALRRLDGLDLGLEPVLVLIDVYSADLIDCFLNCHDLLFSVRTLRIPLFFLRRPPDAAVGCQLWRSMLRGTQRCPVRSLSSRGSRVWPIGPAHQAAPWLQARCSRRPSLTSTPPRR